MGEVGRPVGEVLTVGERGTVRPGKRRAVLSTEKHCLQKPGCVWVHLLPFCTMNVVFVSPSRRAAFPVSKLPLFTFSLHFIFFYFYFLSLSSASQNPPFFPFFPAAI